MLFSEVLRQQMEERGIRARDISAKSGVSESYISRILSGYIKDPAFYKAAAIVSALGMGIDEFIELMEGGEDE